MHVLLSPVLRLRVSDVRGQVLDPTQIKGSAQHAAPNEFQRLAADSTFVREPPSVGQSAEMGHRSAILTVAMGWPYFASQNDGIEHQISYDGTTPCIAKGLAACIGEPAT